MRPRTLDEFVGQEKAVGPGTYLRSAIEADKLQSAIFYGPPGTGKTTLARIISARSGAAFEALNAVMDGLPELRKIVERARKHRQMDGRRTLLFVDEIHRFNKTQQDGLLPHVEEGLFIFIGATIHNPYFALTPALRSRSRIIRLFTLEKEHIELIVGRTMADEERGLGGSGLELGDAARRLIVRAADGDARRALNALEACAMLLPDGGEITPEIAAEALGGRDSLYDRDEEGHYETISAYIKSMRGSDAEAALYWLARMTEGGEDPRFIARRMMIFAAEDVGLAAPRALLLADAAMRSAETIGYPEVTLILSFVTVFLATAPKSNSTTIAIGKAAKEVRDGPRRPVPLHLKNLDLPGEEEHDGYEYPHSYPGAWVEQEYLPDPVTFFEPNERGYEKRVKEYLEWILGERED
ncbi:MAG: replication-associated recombination protein A [bacterium]|nr:replication-associated recombination protein A [bacterium]